MSVFHYGLQVVLWGAGCVSFPIMLHYIGVFERFPKEAATAGSALILFGAALMAASLPWRST